MIAVMKRPLAVLFVGCSLWALASAGLVGCGGDDDSKSSSGGTGGATGGAGGAGGTTGGQGGAAASAGQGGSGGATACDAYCDTMQSNCAGANAQYPSKAACVKACNFIPEGAPSDQAGNSLACRVFHAAAAATDAGQSCPSAGPSGAGVCGTPCEGYCNLMIGVCTSEFTDYSDCTTKCDAFTGKDATDYNTSFVSGDSLNCRIYHATVAASDPSGGTDQLHCPHAGVTPTDQCL
jgi:hypothetical protein